MCIVTGRGCKLDNRQTQASQSTAISINSNIQQWLVSEIIQLQQPPRHQHWVAAITCDTNITVSNWYSSSREKAADNTDISSSYHHHHHQQQQQHHIIITYQKHHSAIGNQQSTMKWWINTKSSIIKFTTLGKFDEHINQHVAAGNQKRSNTIVSTTRESWATWNGKNSSSTSVTSPSPSLTSHRHHQTMPSAGPNPQDICTKKLTQVHPRVAHQPSIVCRQNTHKTM